VRVAAEAATKTITKADVPLKLEEGEMPLNTYSNKAPFKARIKSVERIVGANATGETCNIVIETDGKIPFWEGQSYGVIPPVSSQAPRRPRPPCSCSQAGHRACGKCGAAPRRTIETQRAR
jgi:hypothetical protein